ncbi:protein kinase C-binding protein NELL1-like isoform X5 [Photinus pyralis]|uniref:protein kinase C-binding protein NELL1-like isoform X5 n=1 Tax=Photinus pyralis TaxID=7054 RepID=UPI001267162B|nr:protein kinase C-binding protein NELL1-like isoform X5 [Photinus pyralis]
MAIEKTLRLIPFRFLFSATGLDPSSFLSSQSPSQYDLLAELGLHNTTWAGVSITSGPSVPQQLRPAYLLQGDYRDLKLPPLAFEKVSDLLRRSPEFTISAWVRQETGNTGSLVSFAHGLNRYLELQSSGRKNEIRLHYTSRVDSKVYVETFHYRLADNLWHHVAISVSGSQVELLVDCHPLYKRLLRPGAPDRNFSLPQQLWLGQRNKHYHFKGAMQDVRLIAGPHGYLTLCPSLDSTCPTCGQFSLLQSTVQELTRHLQELSERLVAAEGRISKVEECDCQKSCQFNGSVHADGATWQRGCDLCACVHGEVQCRPVECPVPSCKNPVNITGECCQSCLNIDECQQEGGLEGHHCHQNTRCVNTVGSYVCECLPGYRRIDKFNCAEIDECSTGEHGCDVHAQCVNTLGSYHCVCQVGYGGNGYTCEPICNQSCLNGGVCKSPGKCACPNGYTGASCERDLDECATNSHRCTDASVCVNMIGWYYCECRAGYHSPVIDNNLGTLCQDVDECEQQIHTCHPSAQCINSDGGFWCSCPESRGPNCKLSCIFEGAEVEHGKTVSPVGQPCRRCECNYGVITCREPTCNCSLPGSGQNSCCPQCDRQLACKHQELSDVILMHGERWSYQCQTCECLYGEVDCWDMKCPPLLCDNPIQAPGDCCPHCDDLCSFGNMSLSGKPCTFAGRLYESGAQFADPNDPCVACNCKVPFCAQLVSNVACCVHRMECYAAVIISIVATTLPRWATTDWSPLRHPWPDIVLVLIAIKLKVVLLINNLVYLYKWLTIVLRLSASVTLGEIIRLICRGVELCRHVAGLTFLEPPVQ